MPALESLAAILAAFLVVTVSPGPANIAVATIAMSRGRRRGLRFGLGLSAGLAFWGIVAATGMGAVLQASANALLFLKIAGGLYLLWLALQSCRSALKPVREEAVDRSGGGDFLRGLFLNLSNPKAVVAWMAALSMGLGAEDGSGGVVLASVLCGIIGVLNYTGHAFAFSLPGFMTAYKRFRRRIDGLVGLLFAAGGFGLIRSAFAR